VDSEGHGQPVAHALLAHEDQQHIELFLWDVLQWTTAVESATFVCDKDFAEINAISGVLPDAKIFLCHFHMMKAFTDKMKHLCITDATSLLTLVQKMLRCGFEETLKTTVETIRNQFPTFHTYLNDNWLPHCTLLDTSPVVSYTSTITPTTDLNGTTIRSRLWFARRKSVLVHW